jgi:HK97 family phage major capsid protein
MNGSKPSDGLEREVDDEMRMHRSRPAQVEGVGVPMDIFCTPRLTRSRLTRAPADMQVGVFGQGGALVPTQVSDDPIELLRNKICCARLGATVLDGLSGYFALPRQIAPSTPQSLPETGLVNQSAVEFDQPLISPHRVSADVAYSKQLLLQSAVSIEQWLREDLFRQMGILFDWNMLNGTGSNSQPTGLLQTVGVSSTSFGGTATWQSILEFENELAEQNADVVGGKMAWLSTPNTRNRLKGVAQNLLGATTVSARPIWESIIWPDDSGDGVMNGYRAAVTNQVPNDRVIFGNWKELILAIFGTGFDVVANPYLRAKEAVVEITVNAFIDVAVRHPQSFVVSNDAGSQ